MLRQTCTISPPEWKPPDLGEVITLHLQTITPMFGGGYETREVDPLCVIRPATIRGHLRFWWRATTGAQYASAEKLFEDEEKLWGSANVPGKIAIAVEIDDVGQKRQASQIASPRSSPRDGPQHGYFIWPFQEQRREGVPEAECREKVKFTLRLSFDTTISREASKQVRRSVTAWVAFGGIGARIRRGCGALRLTSNDPTWLPPVPGPKLQEWLNNLAGPKSGVACEHTVLSGGTLVVGTHINKAADEAWRKLGTFWARFRKGHVGGKAYSPMSAGDWSDYRQTLIQFKEPGKYVALAKPFLGLPINYQKFNTAPFSGVIKSAETDRMASPIILKPAIFADGQIRPIVLVMQAPPPKKVRIKDSPPIPLKIPTIDPVLQRLKASSMHDAVLKAAQEVLNASQEVLDASLFSIGG